MVDILVSDSVDHQAPCHLYEMLDNQGEQENSDDLEIGISDDPVFESFSYTGNLNTREYENEDVPDNVKYKAVVVPEDEVIDFITRRLVPEQMSILKKIIKYCKDVKKARNNENLSPKPERIIIHGGAGVGTVSYTHLTLPTKA